MDEDIKNFIHGAFNIEKNDKYHFRELCGLIFIFKSEITSLKKQVVSAEIGPVGIIYNKNEEYYFASLTDMPNTDEIVKEYVEKVLK